MADANRITPYTLAYWAFALSVALLPIGLGGNRPFPLGLAQAGLAFSGICLLMEKNVWKDLCFFGRMKTSLALFMVVLVWAWLQTQGFMPQGWMHPIWQETATTLHHPLKGAIAISPEDSLNGISRLLTYIATGLLGYIFAQEPARARKLLDILWYSAAAICIYGFVVYITGNGTLLWFKKWAYSDDLTATFVNRNHFAIYAGMGFITGAALLFQSWREEIIKKKHREPQDALRNWLVKKGVPHSFVLAIIMLCIVFSHSRAGLMLTVLGFCGYLFFYQMYTKAWRRATIVGVFGVLTLVLVIIAAEYYSSRFAVLFSDYSSRDRMTVYNIIWQALQANPLLGYGLNGFESIFRLYQQGMVMEFNRGHSDALESMLDLGIPMGLLLWTAIGLLLSGLLHGILTRRRHGLYPTLALATSVALLGHSLIDFSMQIPGVVLYWSALLGIGLAQSWRESEKGELLDRKDVKKPALT